MTAMPTETTRTELARSADELWICAECDGEATAVTLTTSTDPATQTSTIVSTMIEPCGHDRLTVWHAPMPPQVERESMAVQWP